MTQEVGSAGIDSVTLVSIFVESVLYGLFIVLFIASTIIQLRKSRGQGNALNRPMLIASFTMFVLATVHIAIDLRRALTAFIGSAGRGGPIALLGQVNAPTYLLKNGAYVVQALVGDAFIIYRLNLVWNGNKLVVYPVLVSFIASIGVGIGALQEVGRASPDASVFVASIQHWIASLFTLTLLTNFSSTTLIAFRIWSTHRQTKDIVGSGRGILPAMVVIIESGSIYSACLVILLSLYLLGSYAQYIVLDAVTQIIGAVFSLIIVRVALGISSETTSNQIKMTTFRVAGIEDGTRV
ncbi:hypothetical protein GALMADRAFT_137431 [Galerina marginata CBS 339.88]|uniref:Uncharacterized protein n=1 Tax=Galerina marginata (strain CBS 339.88) TaxID=685588 RepID=A0A067TBA1_GALM3|nr:hypothetical protein GALMADRAFT_137431 [Galerina marginata CBS 339.88]